MCEEDSGRREGGKSRVCAYLTSFTSFSPRSSCWETKSTNSAKGCCSSPRLHEQHLPTVVPGGRVRVSNPVTISVAPSSGFRGTHPRGVTATFTLCAWSSSFNTATFPRPRRAPVRCAASDDQGTIAGDIAHELERGRGFAELVGGGEVQLVVGGE